MKVLSIDTGSKKSGWSIFDGQTLYEKGITPNNELIELIGMFYFDVAIIEHFNIYMVDLSANNPTKSGKKIIGTRFGLENLNTLVWIGRFYQECLMRNSQTHLIRRDTIKIFFFGTTRVKSSEADKEIRKQLIEHYGKNTFKCVSSHIWSSLALTHYYLNEPNPKIVKI